MSSGTEDAILRTLATSPEGQSMAVLRKKLYLLEALSEENFDHRPHLHGPYSSLATLDRGALISAGFVTAVLVHSDTRTVYGELPVDSFLSHGVRCRHLQTSPRSWRPLPVPLRNINEAWPADLNEVAIAVHVHFMMSSENVRIDAGAVDAGVRHAGITPHPETLAGGVRATGKIY